MSINHLINPNIEPKLDIYVKSLNLNINPVHEDVIEIEEGFQVLGVLDQYIVNILNNPTIAYLTPVKAQINSQIVNRTLVTVLLSGILDIVDLPYGVQQGLRIKIDLLENFGVPRPEYLTCYSGNISTVPASIKNGAAICQQIPVIDYKLVGGFGLDVTLGSLQINPDTAGPSIGTYTATQQPYSLKVSWLTFS